MNYRQRIASLGLLLSLFTSGALFAQSPVLSDYLSISTPLQDQIVDTTNIRISGQASEEVGSILLNETPITLSETGAFSVPQTLDRVGESKFQLKVFNKKRLFLQPILLETLALSVTYQPKPKGPSPVITLHSPKENLRSVKNLVLFKGSTTHTKTLHINDAPIALDNGKFFVKLPLESKDTNTLFTLKATSAEGVETILKRAVYYQVDQKISPNIVLLTPNDEDLVTQNQLIFRGKASHTDSLRLNGNPIPLEKDGRFFHRESLTAANQYYNFTLLASNQDGLETRLKRRIFYADEAGETLEDLVEDDEILSQANYFPIEEAEAPYAAPKKTLAPPTKIEPKDLPKYLPETTQKRLLKTISLDLEGANLKDVLKIISKKSGLNIVSDNTLQGNVNILLQDTSIKNAIDYLLDTQGLSYRIVDNTILIASSRKLNLPTYLETAIIKLNNANAETVSKVIQGYLSKNETVQFSQKDNLLILNVDARKLNNLKSIIQGLDYQEEPQILLEVQVVETSSSELKSRGISWPSSIGLGFEASITNQGSTYSSNPSFQALIQLLESEGKAKVLARPRLKAVNNEEAEIFIGERVPVTQTLLDTTGRISETIIFVDTGIVLKVLPNINPTTEEIKLKIQPEISIITGFKGTNNDQPVISSRKVNTSVWVKDGETVIIGGLFNSQDTKDVSKMPALGNVPILGNLFSGSRKETIQSEIIITVTPKIVGRTESYLAPTN